MTRAQRALAVTAALAWLGLGISVATDWPHHANRPAESTPTITTDRTERPGRNERVCCLDGTAYLVTPMPDGQLLAVSDGTCTYTGPAHDQGDDTEANR